MANAIFTESKNSFNALKIKFCDFVILMESICISLEDSFRDVLSDGAAITCILGLALSFIMALTIKFTLFAVALFAGKAYEEMSVMILTPLALKLWAMLRNFSI